MLIKKYINLYSCRYTYKLGYKCQYFVAKNNKFYIVQQRFYTTNQINANDNANDPNISNFFLKNIKFKNIKYLRGVFITFFFGLVIILIFLMIFKNNIKNYFGQQSANIAVIALQDKNVHLKADNIAKEILTSILTDQDTMDQATQFVIKLCNEDNIKNQLLLLIIYALKTNEVNEAAKQLTINVANNSHVKEQITKLVIDIMSDNCVQELLKNELTKITNSIIQDQNVIENIKSMIYNLLEDQNLVIKASDKFKKILWNSINIFKKNTAEK